MSDEKPQSEGLAPSVVQGGNSDAAEFETLSSRAAYESFLPAAQAIERRVIETCFASPVLVWHNVQRAIAAVLSPMENLARFPHVKLDELQALPQLARGLAYAALLVHYDLESASFGPLLDRSRNILRKLTAAAEALVEAGFLSRAAVDAISGEGRRDEIDEGVALAALLRENAGRIAGHSPLTDDDLREANEVGERLTAMLAVADEDSVPDRTLLAIDMRDRFYTLLSQRYDVLWRCGALVYGREVDHHVPPLEPRHQAFQKTRRSSLRQSSGLGMSAGTGSGNRDSMLRRYAESRREGARPQAPSMGLSKAKFRFWIQASSIKR